MDTFASELDELQVRLRRSLSKRDINYIRNAEIAGRISTLLGLATAWVYLNPFSVLLISIGQVARWGIAHHVLHRAFDAIDGVPKRFSSKHFGKGWRRFWDWNEWMIPAGFQHEHNVHHVYTGGGEDPDVVEANMDFVRRSKKPRWCKYLMILITALTWRLTYYAPGTYLQLRRRQNGLPSTRFEFTNLFFFKDMFIPFSRTSLGFWGSCVLPHAFSRFVLIPALFYPLGRHASFVVLANLLLAEFVTNIYTFGLIASSHTGDDLCRFDNHSSGRAEFYRHQFLGTVNYTRGPAARDFLEMWINFQIEHHLFPNLPPNKYAECASEVEAICERHGVPYRSVPLHRRVWRMLDVVVGNTSMLRESSGATTRDRQVSAQVA